MKLEAVNMTAAPLRRFERWYALERMFSGKTEKLSRRLLRKSFDPASPIRCPIQHVTIEVFWSQAQVDDTLLNRCLYEVYLELVEQYELLSAAIVGGAVRNEQWPVLHLLMVEEPRDFENLEMIVGRVLLSLSCYKKLEPMVWGVDLK